MAGVENSSSWNDFATLAVQLGHQHQPAPAPAPAPEPPVLEQNKSNHSLTNSSSFNESYEEVVNPPRLDSRKADNDQPTRVPEDNNLDTSEADNDDYMIALQLANSQSIKSIHSLEPPIPPARTRPNVKQTVPQQEIIELNGDDDMLAALEYAQDPPSSPDSIDAIPSVNSAPVKVVAPELKTKPTYFPSSFTSSKAAVERAKLARERREKSLKNPGKPRKLSKKRRSFGGRKSNLHDAWAPSSDDDDVEQSTEEEEEEDDDQKSVIVPLKTRIQRAKEAEQLAREKQKQEEEEVAKVNSFGIPHDMLNEGNNQEIDSSPNQQTSPEEAHEAQVQVDKLSRAYARQSLMPESRPAYHKRQSTATTITMGERERRRQSAEMHLLANQQRQQSMMMMPQIKYQQQQQLQNQRQSMWSSHLDHPNQYEKFVDIEPEMDQKNSKDKFAPFGLLQAGMMNKQSKTAKAQEQFARDYGVGMVLPPTKVPEPQFGLLGQIAAHEKDRKRVGGLGALLTERDREKRGLESNQRKYNEAIQQQTPLMPYNMASQAPPQMPMMDPRMSMMMSSPMMMNNVMPPMPPMSAPAAPQYFDPTMSMMAMNAMQQQQLMMQGMMHAQQAYNATLYQFQQSNSNYIPQQPVPPPPMHQYSSDGAGLGVGFNQSTGRMSTGPYMNPNHSSSRPRSTFFSDAK
ncbi:hypothetical protein E3Q02_02949 [Wallemia mellicola]|uniref:Uncharacterized protein n=1 Tax=Wallemia mellicola TaxID=1708541 RepID=A0AB38MSB0_9BASI|nr:hypothetical protein E3Q02_02949 [Wallemia mellicola]